VTGTRGVGATRCRFDLLEITNRAVASPYDEARRGLDFI
jgi:hypothetical protein